MTVPLKENESFGRAVSDADFLKLDNYETILFEEVR